MTNDIQKALNQIEKMQMLNDKILKNYEEVYSEMKKVSSQLEVLLNK